jgi:methylase of polypeptide subunit release factors
MHEGEVVRWDGRCGPFELETSKETVRPSALSLLLAEVIEVGTGDDVISLGCGCGLLSIVAAKLGAERVFGVDTCGDVVEVASRNAARLGIGDRVTFLRGHLFKPLPLGLKAEVIIGDVSGLPDELADRSGWLRGRWGGGPGGSELPIRMLRAAKERLKAGGRLFLPTGGLQNESIIIKAARSAYGKLTQLTERTFTVPRALAETPALVKLVRDKVVDLKEKGSRLLWTAHVWECSGD